MKLFKSNENYHSKFSGLSHSFFKSNYIRFLFPLIGFLCLVWWLVRVIPKPSRAQYPCMKATAPFASGFIIYIITIIAAIFSLKKAKVYFKNSKYIPAVIFSVIFISAGVYLTISSSTESYAGSTDFSKSPVFVPTDPANSPIGIAKGIMPGRVVWKWDPNATSWNGNSGNWWSDANTNQAVVDTMLSQSIRALTGQTTDINAWDMLFKYFNQQHGKGNTGYAAGEKIAIKINLNQVAEYNYNNNQWLGNASFPSPHVVLALARQLVNIAGVPDSVITFYDSNRMVPNPIYTKCKTEFPNLHFMGWSDLSGREKYMRDTTTVHWSENLTEEINGGNPAYLPTVVTQASYIINLGNFKGHRYMGVTFCSKNHFGTISCDMDGVPYQNAPHAAGLHYYTAVHDITITGSPEWTFKGRQYGTYNTLVDLMGHRDVGAKTLLFLIDALYAAETEGSQVSAAGRWLSVPFNNDWTSSLFLSQDNIAIESVGLDFFRAEAEINPEDTTVYGTVDNYLHEGAQADNPPSGTIYRPTGDGPQLQSLGVHEHWNNSADKQYSTNLGTGDGIELFIPQSGSTAVDNTVIPSGFVLNQNYPNPFNPTTTIGYSLPVRSNVTICIFDALGRNIAVLLNGEQSAGEHEVKFNAKNLSSGIYFYRIHARETAGKQNNLFNETRKLVLLK